MKILLIVVVCWGLVCLQKTVYQHIWKKQLGVTVSFVTPFAVEGEESALEEVIENRKRFPLPTLRVKFSVPRGLAFGGNENVTRSDRLYKNDIFSVMPNMRITRKHTFLCEKRGYYTVDSLILSTWDLLMMKSFVETMPEHACLTVYPKRADMKRLLPLFSKLMGERQRRALTEDPFSFSGIRAYVPTDPVKRINWKTSAKTGELMVNTYDSTQAMETRILLNLGSDSEWVDKGVREEAIRVAGTLFSLLAEKGAAASMYTNGCDVVTGVPAELSGGVSASHVRKAKEALARIDLEKPCLPLSSLLEKMDTNPKTLHVLITAMQTEKETYCQMAKTTDALTVIYLHRPDSEKMGEVSGADVVNWEVRFG